MHIETRMQTLMHYLFSCIHLLQQIELAFQDARIEKNKSDAFKINDIHINKNCTRYGTVCSDILVSRRIADAIAAAFTVSDKVLDLPDSIAL